MVPALLLRALKPALDSTVLLMAAVVVAAAAMLGHGHAGRPVVPLLGAPATTAITRADLPAAPRLGLATAATAAAIAIGTVVTAAQTAVMEATAITPVATTRTAALLQLLPPPPPLVLLLGTKRWVLRPDMVDTRATAATALLVLLPAWVVLPPACRLRLPLLVARRLVFLVDSTRSSSSTPVRFRLFLRRRLAMLRLRLRPWTCRPLLLALRDDDNGRWWSTNTQRCTSHRAMAMLLTDRTLLNYTVRSLHSITCAAWLIGPMPVAAGEWALTV